ncbi:protein dd3-3-like [Plakobranchus ocellatus]|uniref:Protein dd3-3-like n=1 Tax=Plakobranchus ocellatus TaxID=259542 RepID=A0AAV4AB47_9GAST|nr:protein dd3-3-like [Plakobranchus ocellatus]
MVNYFRIPQDNKDPTPGSPMLGRSVYSEGNGQTYYAGGNFGVNYSMDATNSTFLGLSKEDASTASSEGGVSELDDAGTYFNLPPRKVTQQGTYHYMSIRNNNFPNRDQKGQEGDGYTSDFYLVTPEDLFKADQPGITFNFEMRVSDSEKVEVYHSIFDFAG